MNKKQLNQRIFNKAVRGLFAQKKRSKKNDMCLYRGPNGTKCAVGHCISDTQLKKHNVRLNLSIRGEAPRIALAASMGCQEHELDREFLADLQNAHDVYKPSRWPGAFREVAEKYGLKMPRGTW